MRLTVCTKQQKIKTRKNNEKITTKKKESKNTKINESFYRGLNRLFLAGNLVLTTGLKT